MISNNKNKKDSCSETIPFNISILSTLQYVKVIFVDAKNELYEINTEIKIFNNDEIQLFVNNKKNVNITCPTGVVLKLVTVDAIYFAKVILKEIIKVNNRQLFLMDSPKKTIRQQNRKHCRINIDRPGIIILNDNSTSQVYLTRSVNISMGGILLSNIESMLNDVNIDLKVNKDDCCNIVQFLESDFTIKLRAKFVRIQNVDNSYRYAFQFFNVPQKYVNPLNKYITSEQIKILKVNSMRKN